jgi:hypothetical protein
MSINRAVVAEIKSARQSGRLTLVAYVHAGRSCALSWRLRAEVENHGGRSTTQQAGLTNGLQTAPVWTIQLNDDVVGIAELVVFEDAIQIAQHRLPLSG